MLNKLLNKIFNKDRDPSARRKADEAAREQPVPEEPVKEAPRPRDEAAFQSQERNLDIPNRLEVGLPLKAVPENLRGKPRAWDVEIMKLDLEGIWIMRTQADDEPIPAEVQREAKHAYYAAVTFMDWAGRRLVKRWAGLRAHSS